MSLVDRTLLPLHLVFGQTEAGGAWNTGLPVLRGDATESLFPGARPAGRGTRFSFFSEGDLRFGVGFGAPGGHTGDEASVLYRELLAYTAGAHLCRVWNYVPAINESDCSGLENYRAFCRGRSLAFEADLGADFEGRLPAGSAVGTDSDRLMVAFVCAATKPLHVENPLQVPAYRYPSDYGPRAPSFARATLLPLTDGRCHAFISGTSSIRGHLTVCPLDLLGQVACTLENLSALGVESGLGSDLAAGRCEARHVRVYLRRHADLEPTLEWLGSGFLHAEDRLTVLRSDICRSDLLVEIEVTVLGAVQSANSRSA